MGSRWTGGEMWTRIKQMGAFDKSVTTAPMGSFLEMSGRLSRVVNICHWSRRQHHIVRPVMPSRIRTRAKRGIFFRWLNMFLKRMSRKIICGNLVATQHQHLFAMLVQVDGKLHQFSPNYMQAFRLSPISRAEQSNRALQMDLCFILIGRVCSPDTYEGADARFYNWSLKSL